MQSSRNALQPNSTLVCYLTSGSNLPARTACKSMLCGQGSSRPTCLCQIGHLCSTRCRSYALSRRLINPHAHSRRCLSHSPICRHHAGISQRPCPVLSPSSLSAPATAATTGHVSDRFFSQLSTLRTTCAGPTTPTGPADSTGISDLSIWVCTPRAV